MSNIQQSWEERSEARTERMVENARREFISLYPGQDFDAQVWDAIHLAERPGANVHRTFGFTILNSNHGTSGISRDPAHALPAYIARVFKSWIVLGPNRSPGTNNSWVRTARYFWHFLQTKRAAAPDGFRWGALTESDFLSFEFFLEEHRQKDGKPLAPDTVLKIITDLQNLVNFLGSRGICRRISYPSRTRSGRKDAVERLEGRRRAADNKLPDTEVLNAIGSIYHRVTVELVDQVSDSILILVSAVAIMLLTGMRIGELLTLPFDCEVEEEVSDGRASPCEKRYGLR